MTRNSKILVISLSALFVVSAALAWGWILTDKAAKADIIATEVEPEQAEQDAFNTPVWAKKPSESNDYQVPPITVPEKKEKAAAPEKQAAPKNEVEKTGQNTGSVSKPEPPPAPEIPEEQKKDPTSKPEYTEEQKQPNKPDPKDDTPKGGETNSKGQVYVPGFGWVTPPPPAETEVADFQLSGEKVGLM